MLIQLVVFIINWFLTMIVSWLPIMTTVPAWLASTNAGISFAWTTINGLVNVSVLIPFFGVILFIAIIYSIFHFTHQNALALGRGVHVDKSHL